MADVFIIDEPPTNGNGAITETKQEEEKRDELALQALEQQSLAAANTVTSPQKARTQGKRKRGGQAVFDPEEEREAKRQRQRAQAVLLDTGAVKSTCTATTLLNLKSMLYLSSHMAFNPGPSLGVRRGACASSLLDAGHMLVVGGNLGNVSTATTEVLSVDTMTFRSGPSMSTQRSQSAAVMLDSRRMIVVGGYDGAQYLDTTEVMNLNTYTFSPGPRLNSRRAAHSVCLLLSRYLLVIGGKNAKGCMESTEILDLYRAPWKFVRGPNMRRKRGGATVAQLDSTKLVVIGGHDDDRTHDTTEILHVIDTTSDPPGMVATLGPFVSTPRSYAASVMLNSGHLYIIGGHDGLVCLDSTEVLRLSTMEFTSGPPLITSRFMCSAALLRDNRIVVTGGTNGPTEHFSTEVLTLPLYSFLPASWMHAL